jgi:hypothetical protein
MYSEKNHKKIKELSKKIQSSSNIEVLDFADFLINFFIKDSYYRETNFSSIMNTVLNEGSYSLFKDFARKFKEEDFDYTSVNYKIICTQSIDKIMIYSEFYDILRSDGEESMESSLVLSDKIEVFKMFAEKGKSFNYNDVFWTLLNAEKIEDAQWIYENFKSSIVLKSPNTILKGLGFYSTPLNVIIYVLNLFPEKMIEKNIKHVLANACKNGQLETVKYLINERSAKLIDSNPKYDPLNNANNHISIYKFLLNQGAIFTHRLDWFVNSAGQTHGLFEYLIDVVPYELVDYKKALVNSSGSGDSVLINKRMDDLLSRFKYTKVDRMNVLKNMMSFYSLESFKTVEKKLNVQAGEKELVEKIPTLQRPEIYLYIIKNRDIDVNFNNGELLYLAVDKIVGNGGKPDVVKALLEKGADPYLYKGKIIQRANQGNIDSIKVEINKYLKKSDQMKPKYGSSFII